MKITESKEKIGYLYRHIRLDTNEVFYIGISTSYSGINKGFVSTLRADDTKRRNRFWKNIANKTDIEVEILFWNKPEKFLLEKEKELIKLYGRRDLNEGTLVNMTDGGEGAVRCRSNVGKVRSEEFKANMRTFKRSEETRKKISLAGKGRPASQKQKETASLLNKGRTWPERWKKVIQKTIDGDIVKIWNCRKEAEPFGFTPKQISNVCRGESKSHKGFKWEYVEE